MRTLVDIDADDIAALDEEAARANASRAALIREAVREFLQQRRRREEEEAFGLWRRHKVDGLAFQRKARAEW
jgi:metal-responsive CopG/Arc/MetJ family transcriptional regulator